MIVEDGDRFTDLQVVKFEGETMYSSPYSALSGGSLVFMNARWLMSRLTPTIWAGFTRMVSQSERLGWMNRIVLIYSMGVNYFASLFGKV